LALPQSKSKRYTWISTKQKNGFRYDNALASAGFNNEIKGVRYNHKVRLKGISDHSLMVVET